ncbi:MAG: ribonuclease III [Pseudomonadota bacterium]
MMTQKKPLEKGFDETGIGALETRVGHTFTDRTLLNRALTHSSLSARGNNIRDLERLEFLGDRVLGLMVAEALWRRHPDMAEGDLAPRLNALVRKETCAKAAIALGLADLVRLSSYEEEAGGREKVAILGDVCEAFLGALYIDGGLEAAGRAFDLFWAPQLDVLAKRHRDAKTALQEWSQERKLGVPHYKVVARDGPAHQPSFKIEVQVEGFAAAHGGGSSKRGAQMKAAKAFLEREGIWGQDD